MKTKMMMISIAVAGLLLCTESVQAQYGVVRRTSTERTERTERRERPDSPNGVERSTRRESRVMAPRSAAPIKIVDNNTIRAFERERYDSDRLKMADMIFSTGGLMTVGQIARVSDIFDYDSNRIKFLKKAYRNCVDRHNFYLVLNTLDYNSSREKIIEFVIETNEKERFEGPYEKVSSSDMSAIIKALKNETFDSSRLKLSRMIVCGSLLTSRQIADMAKTFSMDSHRYDFLLYAYQNCADPQNYVVAANTLEFSTNRDDLIRKINRRR